MTQEDQVVGDRVDPAPAKVPQPTTMWGQYVSLAPLSAAEHGPALWEQVKGAANEYLWTYLFDGPFEDCADFHAALEQKAASKDPLFFAIVDNGHRRALGYAALMRIEPAHRCIEVGNVLYAPVFQRTPGATEAMYLLARHVFEELGYRRYEWKCNALNKPSRGAALRLGFQFEGIFRQHMIAKGRNRDTAWFSMLDTEWPTCRRNLEQWLHPSNFDANWRQIRSLAAFRNIYHP